MVVEDEVVEFRRLDPKLKVFWFVESLLIVVPVMLLLAFFLYSFSLLSEILIPLILSTVLILLSLYALVELEYRSFCYALRPKDLFIQKGILEKVTYLVPYTKIQDVSISRNIVESFLGLTTLRIETATHSGNHNDISLPSPREPDILANELLERAKQIRDGEKKKHEHHETMIHLLRDISKELKHLETSMHEDSTKKDQIISIPTFQQSKISRLSNELSSVSLMVDKNHFDTKKRAFSHAR